MEATKFVAVLANIGTGIFLLVHFILILRLGTVRIHEPSRLILVSEIILIIIIIALNINNYVKVLKEGKNDSEKGNT